MHIAEGIITGVPAVAYGGVGVALVGWGAARMKRFVAKWPEGKPLLGMAGVIVFFISLMPIPAFTGTCTHPCGTPLVAILFGPSIGIALAGVSLLLQAAFFAHGGFSTWGANVLALGFFGCVFGWGTFRLARMMRFPIWAAAGLGGLIGDFAVYGASGLILGTVLAHAPAPQYTLTGYLTAIYAAYLPTQIPIAFGEMFITGLALHYAMKQRPDVLATLGIFDTKREKGSKRAAVAGLFLLFPGLCMLGAPAAIAGSDAVNGEVHNVEEYALIMNPAGAPVLERSELSGMDEVVNERLADQAGITVRTPYIDTEAMGDLWNSLLLLAGGICGFIMGRWWHLLWDKPKKAAT